MSFTATSYLRSCLYQQISTSIETPRRSVISVPAPCTKVPQPTRSQYPSVTQREPAACPGDVFQHRSVQCEQLMRQMRDFTLTPRLEQTGASKSHRATPRKPSQPAEAVHYYEDNPPFRHGNYPGEREFHLPQQPATTPRAEMVHMQERIYRGPVGDHTYHTYLSVSRPKTVFEAADGG